MPDNPKNPDAPSRAGARAGELYSTRRILDLLAERIAAAAQLPLLISQDNAPAFLGISRSAFFVLKSQGVFRPVEVIGNTSYRRSELEAWVRKLKHTRG